MNKISSRWLTIIVTAILTVSGYKMNANPTGDYEIFVVDPPISNHMIQEHRPLPPTCSLGTSIAMTACRGEYESASFVVETNRELKNVLVTAGPLTGAAGTVPATAVDVRVVQPCWVRISDFGGRMNLVLLHDPGLIKIDHEEDEVPFSAGMSFTREPVDTATLQAADVASRQQFWLTVHVPTDAPTGTYSSSIVISADNALRRTLTLTVRVPAFDLHEPAFEYSVFYATAYHDDVMRLNEYRNMVAHGCVNPTFYDAIELNDDGTLNFGNIARDLSLREKAGMKASGPLYLVSSGPINAGTTPLTPEQLVQLTKQVAEAVAWIRERGYSDVYFMGSDEATGEKLTNQRPTWEAVHEGGGKVFISNYGGFYPHVGDIIDLAVITHPSGNPIETANTKSKSPDAFLDDVATLPGVVDCVDWILDPATHNTFNPPDYPDVIEKMHQQKAKVFTYMDSLAGGYGIPEVQRRLRGFGLWKANLGGTMPWSYDHFMTKPHLTAGPLHWSNFHSFVLRGLEGPFDTLQWEGYREGYDDARYLATLDAAMEQCTASGNGADTVKQVQAWLDNVPATIELNAWRAQLVDHIETLLAVAGE